MTYSALQQAFLDLGDGASTHYPGVVMNIDSERAEIGDPTTDLIDSVNPTYFKEGLDEFFDHLLWMRKRWLRFTTVYWPGDRMWRTSHTPEITAYSIAGDRCYWAKLNNDIDVMLEILRRCKATGIRPCPYYNVRQLHWEILSPSPITRTEMMLADIREHRILFDLVGIEPLYYFTDIWGNFGDAGRPFTEDEGGPDFDTFFEEFELLFPTTLLCNNNHEESLVHPSIASGKGLRGRERTAGELPGKEEPQADFTDCPQFADDPWQKVTQAGPNAGAPLWYGHPIDPAPIAGSGIDDEATDAVAQYGRIYRARKAGARHQGNVSPRGDGLLSAGTKAMLYEHIRPLLPGRVLFETTFPVSAYVLAGQALTDMVPELEVGFGNDLIINPPGHAWRNNAGSISVTSFDASDYADIDIYVEGVFMTVPTNLSLRTFVRSDLDGGNNYTAFFTKSGANFNVDLATIPYSSKGTISGVSADELTVGRKMGLRTLVTGNKLRTYMYFDIDGEMVCFGVAIPSTDVSSDTNAGYCGFAYEGPASATTGFHLTYCRITTPDATVPTIPKVFLLGDETSGRHLGFNYYDCKYLKVYRSADGGETWDWIKWTEEATFVDDDLVVGNTYKYKLLGVSANRVPSAAYSNIISMTATEADASGGAQVDNSEIIKDRVFDIGNAADGIRTVYPPVRLKKKDKYPIWIKVGDRSIENVTPGDVTGAAVSLAKAPGMNRNLVVLWPRALVAGESVVKCTVHPRFEDDFPLEVPIEVYE